MEFSRHAKRRLRLYEVTQAQAEAIVASGEDDGTDKDGNPRKIGLVDGRWIRVVVALDDPDTVITLFERRKR